MLFSAKEIILLVIGTALAIATFKTDDPFIFFPCLGASWAAFVYICVSYPGSLLLRVLVAIAISCGLVFIAFRTYKQLPPTELKQPQPPGLKIVISLTGINEEKDLVASTKGATIALFNDTQSVLKDIRQVLRFPTLKSSDVLDKYKSRASIAGGGKPGSDFMVIEIPELRPTQRMVLEVAFAEEQKFTSIESWASQYGYAKDYIQIQQTFLGKERRAEPEK
jgi:hypothetical protein